MIGKTAQLFSYRSFYASIPVSRLCLTCKRSFTALSITNLMSELDEAGSCKNDNKVIELWHMAEANEFNKNNACLRNFLYWFSSLGQIQYTLDCVSSLIPNVTTDDTLQLLTTYKNAKNHKMAQYALQLLVDNQFELNRQHFDVLIATSANNGDIASIIHILNIMKYEYSTNEPNQQTLDLIFASLENYYQKNKYLLSNVDIHAIIQQIQENLFKICMHSNKDKDKDKYIISFMKWYCEFGDVNNAFILYENVSFEKHASGLSSDIMEQLAIKQISLLFVNKINLSKAISLLNQVLHLQIEDNSKLYSFFNLDSKNKQIIPMINTSRHIFDMLTDHRGGFDGLCDVNILNLLLHISYLSGDLHNALYILHNTLEIGIIEPNHNTIQYISKVFALNVNDYVQPRTIDWSISIYNWLLNKYCEVINENELFIRDIISNTTQNLLSLLLNDIDNIRHFRDVLRSIKTIMPEFETDAKLFTVLGKQIVSNQTQLNDVLEKTIEIYGYMVESRDNAANAKKLTSVTDRARLLGSVLTNYDKNICKLYEETVGGSKQSYFQIRRDLQQQFVLKLNRKYALADILTLDVLELTRTKQVEHTTALTDNLMDVNVT